MKLCLSSSFTAGTFRFLASIFFWSSTAFTPAFSEELPKDLFLQCDGKSTMTMISKNPKIYDDTFKVTIHLKDGTLRDVTNQAVLGAQCILVNGEVGCELKQTKYLKEFNSTEVRHSTVFLVRNTGELRRLVDVLTFDGRNTAGKPSVHMQMKWNGTCKKGSPIF